MTRPVLVFDLDGTLVDTAPDLLDSLNHCLETEGFPPAQEADLRSFVGMGGRVMIERAFCANGRALDDDARERLLSLFLDHYSANMPGRSRPFDGVVEAMDRFEADGWTLAVCTNKTEGLAVKLLEALGLRSRFPVIRGGDSYAFKKPDPRHLTSVIEEAGGTSANAILVGDSKTDVATAKAAAVPIVAVPFGYTDRPIAEFEPDRIIEHFDELTVDLAYSLLGG